MFCSKCGQDNADDAVYCKKCGELLEHEAETRVTTRPSPSRSGPEPSIGSPLINNDSDSEKIFSITPTVKFVMLGYAVTVVSAFVLVALLSILFGIAPIVGVIVGMALLLIPVFYHIRKKLVRYTLTDTTIEIDRGLVSRTTQNIPLRRVQDVTVTSTLMQRMLGYGDIRVDNASEYAGMVILDDIDSPKKYADLILRQMRRLDR
jgi:membrane protein YdbS with pleckstrin-like domain